MVLFLVKKSNGFFLHSPHIYTGSPDLDQDLDQGDHPILGKVTSVFGILNSHWSKNRSHD